MIEHLTQKHIEDYCRQQLQAAELLQVSDHLDGCQACRQRVERALNGDAAFLALRSEVFGEAAEVSSAHIARAHLTEEQAASYVDRSLSGEELQTATDHLTICAACALAVDDLQAFKDQIAHTLGREYRPATAPAPAEVWWKRALASLPSPFRSSPGLAFGAALAVLLLMVTGWMVWRATREAGPKQEIVEKPEAPPQPAPEPEPATEPATLVAQLNDGGSRLTLDDQGRLSGADELPPAYRNMLKEALAGGRIETSPHLRELRRRGSPLMSTDNEGNEFSVIEPIGKVLLSDRPTFRWSQLEGAAAYVVEVYDANFDLVAASPQLTARSWAAPPLPRGKVYAWQVKAIKDGQEFTSPRPPAPQARFRILDGAKANEIAKAKRDYPSSHLTLGLLYAEAGLLQEAEQELRALLKANPDSEVARRLLDQVRALRR